MKIITSILTPLLLALAATTCAQPGSLDDSFGTNGKVTTAFGMPECHGIGAVVQPDGKIVVAGATNEIDYSNADFAVARYNSDGTLDSSFGVGGKVTTDFGMVLARGNSVAIQTDGKIVVAGHSGFSVHDPFALARYNTDGSLDNSFDDDGKVTTNFGTTDDIAWAVAIQPDGKILAAGISDNVAGGDADFAIARYNTNGTLDNSFGLSGKVTTTIGPGKDGLSSVAIQTDGKIIVAGVADAMEDPHLVLCRYTTNGTLDNSFGLGGKVIANVGRGTSVVIRTDGKILVAGAGFRELPYGLDFALALFNSNGDPDDSFGVDGYVTTDFGTLGDGANSVAIQPDGRIVVTGQMQYGEGFPVAMYNMDGTLDNSFGTDGKVITHFGTDEAYANSVVIQPDGKIVVAGYSTNDEGSHFAVARYLSDLNVGIIDLSLANNTPLIYPNPIDRQATLEYTLQGAETISIHLLDLQGKTVQTFVEGQQQAVGEHQQAIELSDALPAGAYHIVISSPKGKFAVQVVK